MKVLFTKISNNHNNLRDDTIIGECQDFTVLVDHEFFMLAPSREIKHGFRQVNTSPVVEILSHSDNKIIFKTLSGSVYSIEKFTEFFL